MSYIDRIKARMGTLTSDEWIIAIVTMSAFLPTYVFAGIVCSAALFALFSPSRRNRMYSHPAFYITMLMLPVLMAPALLFGNYTGMIYGAATWLIMVFLLFASSVMTRWLFSNILDLIMCISVVAAVYGVFCLVVGRLELGRVASIFENPNHYGYCIELFVLAAMYQFINKQKKIYIFLAAMNLLCNFMCDCRTAALAVLFSVTVFIFLRIRKTWLLAAMGGLALVLFALIQIFPVLAPRFTVEALISSIGNRAVYWGNAMRWITRSPIFGYGLCGYEMLSAHSGGRVLAHAHNLPLNILLDVGIVGVLALFSLVKRHLSGIRTQMHDRRYSNITHLVLAALAATAVHGLTDVPILGVNTSVIFVLIISGMSCARNDCAVARAHRIRLSVEPRTALANSAAV